MADAGRKEKLAAAKKKLKQFQSKSGRTPSDSPAPTSRNKTPAKGKINGAVNGQGSGQSSRASPLMSDNGDNVHVGGVQSVYSTPQGATNSLPHSRLSESSERLHQLSRQINGLLSETQSYIQGEEVSHSHTGVEQFEERNRELSSLLQKHLQANEQLNVQVQQLRVDNDRMHTTVDHERRTFDERLKRELSALKEQLQVHIQTIGILVAEKTELQSSLNQNQKLAEQRLEEIEEFSGRLKASRQRVGDLERSYTDASSASHKSEKSLKDVSKDVDRLKMDLYRQNKASEEFQQQNSELQGKLQKRNLEYAKVEDEVIELRGKLEMTDLHMQQLQNTGQMPDNSAQIESLLAEKAQLLSKIDQYEQAFDTARVERDQMAQQYQEYIDQLTVQTQHLQTQINSLIDEREQYAQKHKQLETVIQELQTKQESSDSEVQEDTKQRDELMSAVEQLQQQLHQLTQQYQAQVNDNSQLSRLVAEREERVMELELTVHRLNDDQVDKDSLLNSMQSDKTALSRAIAQNKELKHQLAELQNGFVKMSNENMELMTNLQTEEHTCKELATRLGQQEEELKDIREQLSSKESRLKTLEETSRVDNSHHHGDSPIHGHMHSYNEQIPLVENLQKELGSAQDTVNALTNQNSELRSQMLQGYRGSSQSGDYSTDEVDHLNTSVRQLESERNQVLEQLREEQHERQAVQTKLHNMQHELAMQAPATLNGDLINKTQFEALQHAMQQLEGKYTIAMRNKADLTDEIEQLEHIIMQLQGETETIGEYVQLYQMQRQVLRRKQGEKDDYISRLSRDREEMQDKLAQLQALVMQLLGDRNMLHAYEKQGQGSQEVLANHVASLANNAMAESTPKRPHHKRDAEFGAKLDSSNLEDWPDYSSDDSDDSEVEPIIAGSESSRDTSPPQLRSHNSSMSHDTTKVNIAHEDLTAQRIMHLLTELGSSNVVNRTTFTDRNFIHCKQCTGRLLNV